MAQQMASPRSGWRLFPFALIAALGVVVAVNVAMAVLAHRSAPGLAVQGSFATSNAYGAIQAEAKRQVKAMAPGSRHQVTLTRGARVVERSVVPAASATMNYKISLDPGATYEQLALRQQWLGYTAPAKGEGGNSSLRDAALKLFKQDPTAGADPEDAAVVVQPAGGGKGKKKSGGAKKPKDAKAPAK